MAKIFGRFFLIFILWTGFLLPVGCAPAGTYGESPASASSPVKQEEPQREKAPAQRPNSQILPEKASLPDPALETAPREKPKPPKEGQPPEPAKKQEKTCFLSINCSVILDNLDRLDPDKKELLPEGGVILPETEIPFTPGESVFDLLLRVTKENKIHMEYTKAPGVGSVYIEGIANLYEFDCGELSGWVYKVNGGGMSCGCSLYEVQEGDTVEWLYTCDLGRDVGALKEGAKP